MGEVVGYVRVSTSDQSPALQREALERYGCTRLLEETGSGARSDRPVLARLLTWVREGDTLVVWRLDRLGRSLKDLIAKLEEIDGRKVRFVSLTESIDTSTAAGRLIFHVLGAIAQFERELLIERTRAGLAASRASGRRPGPRPLLTAAQLEHARELRAQGRSLAAIAALLGVGKSTVFRALSPGGSP